MRATRRVAFWHALYEQERPAAGSPDLSVILRDLAHELSRIFVAGGGDCLGAPTYGDVHLADPFCGRSWQADRRRLAADRISHRRINHAQVRIAIRQRYIFLVAHRDIAGVAFADRHPGDGRERLIDFPSPGAERRLTRRRSDRGLVSGRSAGLGLHTASAAR